MQYFTSTEVQCDIGAQETMLPIRITNGTSIDLTNATCSSKPQPPPEMLMNVTRLSQMAFQKMQDGVDGMVTPMQFVPSSTNVMSVLQDSLSNMGAIGATEMYTSMAADSSLRWAETMTVTRSTRMPAYYLGHRSLHLLFFMASPATLLVILLCGWFWLMFKKGGHVTFNPLLPTSAAKAGREGALLGLTAAHDEASSKAVIRYSRHSLRSSDISLNSRAPLLGTRSRIPSGTTEEDLF